MFLGLAAGSHTSLKSKFARLLSPEKRTIYSESSRHGDSKNLLGKGVTSNATFKKFNQKIAIGNLNGLGEILTC